MDKWWSAVQIDSAADIDNDEAKGLPHEVADQRREALHTVIIRLTEKPSRRKGRKAPHLKNTVKRGTANKLIDSHRKAKREIHPQPDDGDDETDPAETIDQLIHRRHLPGRYEGTEFDDPAVLLEEHEEACLRIELYKNVMALLTEEERFVFERSAEGYTLAEIAAMADGTTPLERRTLEALKKWVQRARKNILRRMQLQIEAKP